MTTQVLNRWGVIAVEGEDAVTFLQAQLSNDVAGMAEGQVRLAAFCTAKGRMLGSFFVLRQASKVLLVTRTDTVEPLVKRLSMFVLRSKCKVRNACADYALAFLPNTEAAGPMRVLWRNDGAAVVSLRSLAGATPGFSVHPVATAEPLQAQASDDAFEHVLQQLGVAYITQTTVEMFIPQAVNFDLVGGVSFSKGCYPGQEIVARSHYLGKVKRRAFPATASHPLPIAAGTDVWQQGKTNEPSGLIINSVTHQGKQHFLVELVADDALAPGNGFYSIQGETQVDLQVLPPPYDVHQKGSLFDAAQ
ncbi:MAG TPA: folate-binding protein [Limnobacter sp.]|nr:folate-binding protein [Limnobacter sp.]